MAIDWGLALGAAGVVGVPVAIGLTMAATTPGEFRFVRGCFILAATLTLTSFLWLTYEQPLGLGKILSAGGIGALALIGLVVALDWVTRKEIAANPPTAAAEISLFLKCDFAQLPKTMPPEGEIYLLETVTIKPWDGAKGGGLTKRFGPPGGELQFLPDKEALAIGEKCDLFNYGNETIFNVKMDFTVTLVDAVKSNGGGATTGSDLESAQWSFVIPKLDPGRANPFTFYMFNRNWPYFLRFGLPSTAMFQRGDGTQQTARILTPQSVVPIMLNPAPEEPSSGTPNVSNPK